MLNLRNIPAIDELLALPQVITLLNQYNREFITANLRQAVAETREHLRLSGKELSKESLIADIQERMTQLLAHSTQGTMQTVLNGTGVVLHTNLGRAPLSERALSYMQDMGRNYNNLEFDLGTGERGTRYHHVEEILLKLTGAEAGLVVNNNAAAVLLGLNTLAKDREVIVSRGQLVEIGGAFRIPEVMKQSGARLIEVGTTNKTYVSDYSNAINENTGLLFTAHTSNYKIVGFTEEVPLNELVALGKERQVPVMQDLGSGIMTDLKKWGLKEEPTVQESIATGVDIITFSGDKLLGGPQAGIVAGKKPIIAAMKKNQLTRALRVDKLTIAALEGTLLEYLCGDPLRNIPILRMLTASLDELNSRAGLLAKMLSESMDNRLVARVKIIATEDMVGGGAYPTYKIPGYGVQINFTDKYLDKIARRLRGKNPAVLTRIQDDTMIISMRTINPGEEVLLVDTLITVCQEMLDYSSMAEGNPCKD